MSEPAPVARFVGAALMAVGLLIALLCGGCGAIFLVVFLADSFNHPGDLAMGIMTPLFLGGVPALIGFGIFAFGRSLRRPASTYRPERPTDWPKPPPSDPPPG